MVSTSRKEIINYIILFYFSSLFILAIIIIVIIVLYFHYIHVFLDPNVPSCSPHSYHGLIPLISLFIAAPTKHPFINPFLLSFIPLANT